MQSKKRNWGVFLWKNNNFNNSINKKIPTLDIFYSFRLGCSAKIQYRAQVFF